jgi:NAD(P)-dependent dehydrogenase (short-subunit alcohol dehydrogenase family)
MGQLDGKVAVITGGASGIGEGTVRTFVNEGARVIIADVHEGRGHALAEELGAGATAFVKTNVTSEDDVKNAIANAVSRFGRLDTIFNNAGLGGVSGPIDQTDMGDAYRNTVDVLFTGVVLGMKHAVPIMKEQGSGSIVSTSSVAGLRTAAGPNVYSAMKAAVVHLTRCVAAEVAPFGIRVNAVCPGAIPTRIFAGGVELPDVALQGMLNMLEAGFKDAQPIKRSGQPADIANAVLWLASDAASFVTGQAIAVDGGITLHSGGFLDGPQDDGMTDEQRLAAFAAAIGVDASVLQPQS